MWFLIGSSLIAWAAFDFFCIIKKDNETNYQKICQLHSELKKINRKRYDIADKVEHAHPHPNKLIQLFKNINQSPQVQKVKHIAKRALSTSNTSIIAFAHEAMLELQTLNDTFSCILQMKWEQFIMEYCTPKNRNISVHHLTSDRVAVTYKISGNVYKVVIPMTQMSRMKSFKILSINGIPHGDKERTSLEIKNDVLPYFGPDEDGYQMQNLYPRLLGYQELTFTYISRNGIDTSKFSEEEIIVLNE